MAPRIALVLGGGGSRGIAHVGVLSVLQRENIPIDLIVGTSMGAIVGALFAAGRDPRVIAERMADLQGINVFGASIFTARGRQRRMADHLAAELAGLTFADLKIPLVVTAIDMVTGSEVVIDQGPLIPALLASSAVPAVFPPVELNGMQLADGGVIDSVATSVAYGYNPQKVIAVDVYPPLSEDDPWSDPITSLVSFDLPFDLPINMGMGRTPNMFGMLWRAFRVSMWYIHERRLKDHPPHLLLRPRLGKVGSMDFTDLQAPFYAGAEITEEHLDQIRELVESTRGKEASV
jgi:NTE family protein